MHVRLLLFLIAVWLAPNVLNAQIAPPERAVPDTPAGLPVLTGINTEVLLMYQGITCSINKHDLKKYEHYALYKAFDGSFGLKKTQIQDTTLYGAYTRLRSPERDSVELLLAVTAAQARKPTEGAVKIRHFSWTTGAIDYTRLDIPDTEISLVVDTDNADQPDFWQQAALVLLDKKARTQQVLCRVERAANPSAEMIFTPPYTLHWFGDLDGDGKPDYIISGESGNAAEERLYLSSYAYRTELVREVARWNYCLSDD
jgi:hypothetical protein